MLLSPTSRYAFIRNKRLSVLRASKWPWCHKHAGRVTGAVWQVDSLPPLRFGSRVLISGGGAAGVYATEDKGSMHMEYWHYVEHPVCSSLSWSSCLWKVTLKIQNGVAHKTQPQIRQLFKAGRDLIERLQNHPQQLERLVQWFLLRGRAYFKV